jgi:hypothetical protein
VIEQRVVVGAGNRGCRNLPSDHRADIRGRLRGDEGILGAVHELNRAAEPDQVVPGETVAEALRDPWIELPTPTVADPSDGGLGDSTKHLGVDRLWGHQTECLGGLPA